MVGFGTYKFVHPILAWFYALLLDGKRIEW